MAVNRIPFTTFTVSFLLFEIRRTALSMINLGDERDKMNETFCTKYQPSKLGSVLIESYRFQVLNFKFREFQGFFKNNYDYSPHHTSK